LLSFSVESALSYWVLSQVLGSIAIVKPFPSVLIVSSSPGPGKSRTCGLDVAHLITQPQLVLVNASRQGRLAARIVHATPRFVFI
jgi:hypothetical protein